MAFATPETAEDIAVIVGGSGERAVLINADDEVVPIALVDMAPATVWGILSGEADAAPDQLLAWEEWESGVSTGVVSSGVVMLTWPADTPEAVNLPRTLAVDVAEGDNTTVTSTVAIAVAEITDLALLARQPRTYQRRALLRNTLAPSMTMTVAGAAAGRMTLRLAPGVTIPSTLFGETLALDMSVTNNVALITRAQVLGKDVPPISVLLTERGGAGITSTSFLPYMRTTDPVVVCAMRFGAGSNIALPSGKGYDSRTEGGFTSGLVTLSDGSQIRIAVSEGRATSEVFNTIGSFNNSTIHREVALRGCNVVSVEAMEGTNGTVAWPQHASLPAGTRVLGFTTYNNLNTNLAAPFGGRPVISPCDFFRESVGNRSTGVFLTGPRTSFEPDPVALASGSWHWVTVTVILGPEA